MDNELFDGAATNAQVGFVAGAEHAKQVAALTAEVKSYDDGRPYRIREDGEIEIVERLQDAPTFRRGDVTFYEALSFARFVKRFRNPTSMIFADAIARKFTAALDYHPESEEQGIARWDLFRAVLPLRHTPSWETWAKVNGVKMSQADFGQFLEDQIPDIAEPAGAQLVEIARTLEAKTEVQFESHIRADNGAHRFQYIENISGSASGTITIPQEFTLILQPFQGSKQYEIKARLRYRITSKVLTMWFDLVRLQDVLTEAFNDELLKIDTELGASSIITPIYNGPAPEAQKPPQ